MGKGVIAIAFSDLHINLWAKFNENNHRTLNSFRVLSIIQKQWRVVVGVVVHEVRGIAQHEMKDADGQNEAAKDHEESGFNSFCLFEVY